MLFLDTNIATQYKSNSQKIRIITESWVWKNVFCPNCWNPIFQYDNNKPVADFYCNNCIEDYELKSWKTIGNKITDGAYSTMIERLSSNKNPNFFFMNYTIDFKILNFFVIPKHYFIPNIIEKRKPLWEGAKRAWWVWCNILLKWIPESWKIFYIKSWNYIDKNNILDNWAKTLFLKETKTIEWKGWIIDIMKCIEELNKNEFTLEEIYKFENKLKQKYPNNNFIKDKIRQQLQILRDKSYLKFISPWKYQLL